MSKANAALKNDSPTSAAPSAPSTQGFPLNGPPGNGFTDEGRPDIDGWLRPTEGLVVWGRIVGYFSFEQHNRDGSTKAREVVCIKVGMPTEAALKGSEETVLLQPGQILAASMMFALEPIKAYVEKRGEVWVQFVKKESIGGGQFVWKVKGPFCKGEKAKLVTQTHQAPGESDEGGEGLPF